MVSLGEFPNDAIFTICSEFMKEKSKLVGKLASGDCLWMPVRLLIVIDCELLFSFLFFVFVVHGNLALFDFGFFSMLLLECLLQPLLRHSYVCRLFFIVLVCGDDAEFYSVFAQIEWP